jgi:hypothetical protein
LNSHGRLEKGSLQHDTVLLEILVSSGYQSLLNLCSGCNIMSSINQDLWFDNRNKSSLLANASISGKSPCSLVDGKVGGQSLLDIDAYGSAPLCKTGSLIVVLATLFVKAV